MKKNIIEYNKKIEIEKEVVARLASELAVAD